MPAVAEKGYLDVRVEVATPGGHSSVPPQHTVRWFITLHCAYILILPTPLPPVHWNPCLTLG